MRIERLARSRKAMAFGFVLALVIAGLLLTAKPAHAKTFTVNSTGDAGDIDPGDGVCDVNNIPGIDACTLRAAIQEANAFRGKDTIRFDIGGGSGVKTISPNSELPTITEPLTIDGYTQGDGTADTADDAVPNTEAVGTNAVLRIVVNGASAPQDSVGLRITGGSTTIRGLVINGFRESSGGGDGIVLSGAPNNTNNVIEGNFIGTNAAGTAAESNEGNGVIAFGVSSGNRIGGTTPAARNLISGNGDKGIQLTASDANTVQGNLIGTDKTGGDLGNGNIGVRIDNGSKNVIADNVLAFNGDRGVFVRSLDDPIVGNRILRNSIHSNGALGIDLSGGTEDVNGVTANDPKDPDKGSNNLQNFPEITSATISGGQITIDGLFNSRPRRTFTLQFFSSPEADPSGFGEGKTFLGQKTVKTSRKGDRSFSFTFTPAQPVTAGEFVTATATRNSTGDTSEFSGAVSVS